MRSYYLCCCTNMRVIFSHCVHLKLGHWFHALMKVCSDCDDIVPFNHLHKGANKQEIVMNFKSNVIALTARDVYFQLCWNVMVVLYVSKELVECHGWGSSASDLCCDGQVVRMWVKILAVTMVLVFLSKTLYHNCFSPPRSKWVPVRAELVVVFD